MLRDVVVQNPARHRNFRAARGGALECVHCKRFRLFHYDPVLHPQAALDGFVQQANLSDESLHVATSALERSGNVDRGVPDASEANLITAPSRAVRINERVI
jgi:hypothetical protein